MCGGNDLDEISAQAEHWREMTFANESEPLPALYGRWLGELLPSPIPRESNANCSACPMCSASPSSVEVFLPSTKCCTYFPELPNFLLGGLLADSDTDPRIRETLETQINQATLASPLGLKPPPLLRLAYEAGREACFGKSEALTCPYLLPEDGGMCGVWRHRNSVCTTWFCKHIKGQVGAHFWREVASLLQELESALSMWACGQLLPANRLSELASLRDLPTSQRVSADLTGSLAAQYSRAWMGWRNASRADFYVRTFELVERMTWPDVTRVGGNRVLQLSRNVAEQLKNLRGPIAVPQHMQLAPFTVYGLTEGRVLLITYSRTDGLVLRSDEVHTLLQLPRRPLTLDDLAGLLPLARVQELIAAGVLAGEVVTHEADG